MSSREGFDSGAFARDVVVDGTERTLTFDVDDKAVTCEVDHADVVELAGVRVVRIRCGVEEAARIPVADLENLLTRLGAEVAADLCDGAKIFWVSRTALVEEGEAPVGWAMHPDDDVQIPHPTRGSAGIVLGWGNCTILDQMSWSDAQMAEIVAGLTDAQILWVRLDCLSKNVRNKLVEQVRSNTVRRRTTGSYLPALRRYRIDLALQNALYDDFVTSMQGLRRSVADAMLRSWRYEATLDRVASRVEDFERISRANGEVLRRRYQMGVELVLYALGGLAIIQTALDFIATAYSNAEVVPGEERWFSMLHWIRTGHVDLGIALVTALTLIVMGLLVHAGRRGIEDA